MWPSFWLQQAAYLKLLHDTGAAADMFPGGVPEIRMAILHLNAQTRGEGKGSAMQGNGWRFVEQASGTRFNFASSRPAPHLF